ncbi:MAG: aromatic amino acid ammonia-lyase [Chloroflexota bacterium]
MSKIRLNTLSDINWKTVQAVAYDGAKLTISAELLEVVENGRLRFQQLIDQGIPCYGVTTGLGQLVTLDLSEAERQDLPHNILRARAAAIGPPLSRPIVRAMMMMRLVNFLSGRDGVRPELCTFLVDRLNDGFTPWVPSIGHGMGADAIAHTHAFQTFIGEGFVMAENGKRVAAAEALAQRGVAPMQLGKKEGLALLNGISAAPAYALDAHREVMQLTKMATVITAVSCEGVAAPKDSFDLRLKEVSFEPGTNQILDWLQPLLRNSQIQPFKLQSAISYRVIPQVHGAMLDALASFRQRIEAAIHTFSDNPLMVEDAFLSVGLFHNQHLVNQADQVALNIAHIGNLSVRRLHRLLSPQNTGLNPQLAARPGLDAGLVVAQKAALGILARLKLLANPVSIMTEESSAGQEDYMSMAFPTIARLYEMVSLTKMILAYELLAGLTALNLRTGKAGDGVTAVLNHFIPLIKPLHRDRSPGPDVELILTVFDTPHFQQFVKVLIKQ